MASTIKKVKMPSWVDVKARLYDLRNIAANVGYGVEGDMGDLLAETYPDDERNRD